VLAPTGKEGSHRCDTEDFDLVIVSLYLEDGDGLRLCSHLRSNERTRRLPILLVIEPEEMGGLVKGFEIGVNDYLFRPIEGNELWARVRTQMRRKRYQDLMRENYQRSLSLALTDSLTGLYNRRYLNAHLSSMIERAQASGKPLSLFMLDIDHFKRVNDTYGHASGDEVLRQVAGLISHNLREFDLTARIGGEEFVVVMPDTPVTAALMVADRMRKMVAETDMPLRGAATTSPQRVTVSIGVANLVEGEGGDELLRRADEALYAAKNAGRNQVVIAPATATV
jgi:two-component system cell cycle response regulator